MFMNYSQLRAFHAVATYGGFSKAAAKLNLTQPAISDQVRKLEERFDVLLFDRRKRLVRTTDLGERLLKITRRMFEMEDEALELLSESQALRTGSIHVAADSPAYAVKLIRAFRNDYPGISISLGICNSEDVLHRLLGYDADIGLLAQPPRDTRLKTMSLSRDPAGDPIIAFVRKDHPLADKRKISLSELAEMPVIMREPGSNTRRIVEQEAARIGSAFNVVMESNSREAMRDSALAGIGAGILSKPEFGEDERLAPLELSDCDKRLSESVVCLKERAHLRMVDAFWQTAKAVMASDEKVSTASETQKADRSHPCSCAESR